MGAFARTSHLACLLRCPGMEGMVLKLQTRAAVVSEGTNLRIVKTKEKICQKYLTISFYMNSFKCFGLIAFHRLLSTNLCIQKFIFHFLANCLSSPSHLAATPYRLAARRNRPRMSLSPPNKTWSHFLPLHSLGRTDSTDTRTTNQSIAPSANR